LEPRWYIGGYGIVADGLIRAVVNKKSRGVFRRSRRRAAETADALSALIKATLLDMELSISVYLEEIEERRRESEEARKRAELNQAKALDIMAQALTLLAGGDLQSRIAAEMPEAYQRLQKDFNAAVSQLETAMGRIAGAARSIGATTREIAAASENLSKQTEQQAATLEQTAAALEEITVTVKKTAEGAGHATEVVGTAKNEAHDSGAVVSLAVEAMERIEKSSQKIGQIIGVIDEIAFQTNLLALNAGVEAARAGDAGKGFAVVAAEVRALAQRSGETAKEIKSLISSSAREVEQGVELVHQTGKALEKIVAQVAEIDRVVADIAHGAREQATSLAEVNTAVSQIDQNTQKNAAVFEQTASAALSLQRETEELLRSLSVFRAGAGDTPVRKAAKPAAAYQLKHASSAAAFPKVEAESWEQF
jgi:methyl-accepting chemotaxis protein